MRFQTRQLALFCVLSAASIGIQLAPRPPNIESTSLITFFAGAIFGAIAGGLFGTLVMFVNGFLSPWGAAGLILPFQIVGMIIIGVAGGIFRRYGLTGSVSRMALESMVLGAFLTLTYDVVTNVGVALMSNIPVVIALITGVVFSVIHIASNTVLFGLAFAPLLETFRKIGESKTVAAK